MREKISIFAKKFGKVMRKILNSGIRLTRKSLKSIIVVVLVGISLTLSIPFILGIRIANTIAEKISIHKSKKQSSNNPSKENREDKKDVDVYEVEKEIENTWKKDQTSTNQPSKIHQLSINETVQNRQFILTHESSPYTDEQLREAKIACREKSKVLEEAIKYYEFFKENIETTINPRTLEVLKRELTIMAFSIQDILIENNIPLSVNQQIVENRVYRK